jgi:hypothetical protein
MAAQSEFDDKVRVSNDPRRTPDERDAARVQGEDAADRAETLALVSDIFLAGAVVAGGATLLVWLSERKAERRARVRAGPMVLRSGGGGVVLGGKF